MGEDKANLPRPLATARRRDRDEPRDVLAPKIAG